MVDGPVSPKQAFIQLVVVDWFRMTRTRPSPPVASDRMDFGPPSFLRLFGQAVVEYGFQTMRLINYILILSVLATLTLRLPADAREIPRDPTSDEEVIELVKNLFSLGEYKEEIPENEVIGNLFHDKNAYTRGQFNGGYSFFSKKEKITHIRVETKFDKKKSISTQDIYVIS
ncbi:hypothetical protein [Telmatospirillum sp.]|uniref:hypothetical protein n=1 Tax=Telmatospirillum sp. TaxID=2079197 RepID=UPI00284258C6|nr:hypothetical protein [Telmatospirillum sp.]MDR3436853.1 hypothetical protein [Telmatospirillum sp.]